MSGRKRGDILMADLKALCQRFYDDVMTKGDLEAADELISEGFVDHEEFPGLSNDKAGTITWLTMMREAFPDFSTEVVAMVNEGDEVWVQAVMRGTHQGEFMGIEPTGRSVEVTTIDRMRLAGDKVVEHWGATDTLLMMQQLGVIPEEP